MLELEQKWYSKGINNFYPKRAHKCLSKSYKQLNCGIQYTFIVINLKQWTFFYFSAL